MEESSDVILSKSPMEKSTTKSKFHKEAFFFFKDGEP